MKISLKNVTLTLKISFLVLVFGLVIVLLIKGSLTQGIARTQTERVLENTIPKDVPIKLKIKKEKEQSFKDLNNKKWISEYELELTNTGDKPIYYLDLLLVSDVKLGSDYLVFPLSYGRNALGDIVSKALPEDIPINPGETVVFKIHPSQISAWEKSVREEKHPDAGRIQIKLETLSFGDGTGLFGNSGTAYPPVSKQQPGRYNSSQNQKTPNSRGPRSPDDPGSTRTAIATITEMPVNFLPANFLSLASNTSPSSVSALPEDGCLFAYCVGVIPSPRVHVCYNCPDQNRPGLSSSGVCKELVYGSLECTTGTYTYLCQTIDLPDCGFGPGPPAPPSPPSSPAPCQYCPDPNIAADCSNPSNPICPYGKYPKFGCCYPLECPPVPEPS